MDTPVAAAASETRIYIIWFERIGDLGSIPPLDVELEATDLTGLTERIRVYSQARHPEGHVLVDLDVRAWAGELRDEHGDLGHFVVSRDRQPIAGGVR